MKECIRCKELKPENRFYIYKNKTTNKIYSRNVCNDCMYDNVKRFRSKLKGENLKSIQTPIQEEIIQPDVPESIIEDFSNNPDYRCCIGCKEYKLLSEFYRNNTTGYYMSKCKVCHNAKAHELQKKYYEEKYRTCGGSEVVKRHPDDWTDEFQRDQCHWLLETIGWEKNNVNGKTIWTRLGIKHLEDDKIIWDKIKPKEPKPKQIRRKRPTYNINQIIQLRSEGKLMREIAEIIGCSKPTIVKILKRINNN